MNSTNQKWLETHSYKKGNIYAMLVKNVRHANRTPTEIDFRFNLVREMLDEFPILRERIKTHLKVQVK